jgi:hypothetical protein
MDLRRASRGKNAILLSAVTYNAFAIKIQDVRHLL